MEPTDPAVSYPLLIEAVGRCPPEDVGGPPGYAEFLTVIADPGHERHAETVERHGEIFDPHAVDLVQLDLALQKTARSWSVGRPRSICAEAWSSVALSRKATLRSARISARSASSSAGTGRYTPERARLSSAHCRRTDSLGWVRSSIAWRSGVLIVRTSWIKNPVPP